METKKLTAKDLMIGDLICYCKENNYVTKVESIHNAGHASVSDEYSVKCFRDRKDPLYDKNPIDFFNVEILHPIPLTAEILEKNVFYFGYTSQQEDAASQIGCSCEKAWTYDEGGGSIQVTFPNECDGGLIVLDDQDFDKNLEFVFANQIYVHELQHVIRLCGIEKNIII